MARWNLVRLWNPFFHPSPSAGVSLIWSAFKIKAFKAFIQFVSFTPGLGSRYFFQIANKHGGIERPHNSGDSSVVIPWAQVYPVTRWSKSRPKPHTFGIGYFNMNWFLLPDKWPYLNVNISRHITPFSMRWADFFKAGLKNKLSDSEHIPLYLIYYRPCLDGDHVCGHFLEFCWASWFRVPRS